MMGRVYSKIIVASVILMGACSEDTANDVTGQQSLLLQEDDGTTNCPHKMDLQEQSKGVGTERRYCVISEPIASMEHVVCPNQSEKICTTSFPPQCYCPEYQKKPEDAVCAHYCTAASPSRCFHACVRPKNPTPVPDTQCIVGGCSSQLCVKRGSELVSTCEWREHYACYKEARCEVQSSGKCGWTLTNSLKACLVGHGLNP